MIGALAGARFWRAKKIRCANKNYQNRYILTGLIKSGFFLRKNPLACFGFGVQQSENRYGRASHRFGSCFPARWHVE